jgi:hypothetical protein
MNQQTGAWAAVLCLGVSVTGCYASAESTESADPSGGGEGGGSESGAAVGVEELDSTGVRVLHAAPAFGALDVFVAADGPGDALNPFGSAVNYDALSSPAEVTGGFYFVNIAPEHAADPFGADSLDAVGGVALGTGTEPVVLVAVGDSSEGGLRFHNIVPSIERSAVEAEVNFLVIHGSEANASATLRVDRNDGLLMRQPSAVNLPTQAAIAHTLEISTNGDDGVYEHTFGIPTVVAGDLGVIVYAVEDGEPVVFFHRVGSSSFVKLTAVD